MAQIPVLKRENLPYGVPGPSWFVIVRLVVLCCAVHQKFILLFYSFSLYFIFVLFVFGSQNITSRASRSSHLVLVAVTCKSKVRVFEF